MKNRNVEVTIGKTINLGNFESVKIQVGLSGSIKDGISSDLMFNRVYADLVLKLDDYCYDLEKRNMKSRRGKRKRG